MRLATVPFLLALLVSVATSQSQDGERGSTPVVVVNNRWTPRHFRPESPNFDDALNGRGGHREPSSIPDSIWAMQKRTENQPSPSSAVDGYLYNVTVKNVGTKAVTRIGWDYTIASPDGVNMTHHYFESRIKIGPGKQKTLSKFARTPPAATVDASNQSKRMVEQVIIHYVEYEDGSLWRKGSAPES